MNALEKLVDLFTACLLLFGIPLLYYGGKTELVRQMTAGRACESFLSRCSIFGEITDIFLGELEREMISCGCREYVITGERDIYVLSQGALQVRKGHLGTERLKQEIALAGTVSLLPGDELSVVVYFDGVPAVYAVTVCSGGAEP